MRGPAARPMVIDVPSSLRGPMTTNRRLSIACALIAAVSLQIRVIAAEESSGQAPILWTDRGDVRALDLFGGAGGKEHQPAGKFTFEKEDMDGTAAKFIVRDEQGVRWKIKLGEEVKSETAATRLVWAAGYFTDEDYYLPELRVENMGKMKRGSQFVSADGVVTGVRMERYLKGEKKEGNWSWFKNPFTGTKEMNGLRIMMALINNWDLKEVNNSIYQVKGERPRYVVTDLGATFGETGNPLTRSKSNPEDYGKSEFIQKVTPDHVDFHLNSRPFFLTAIDVPNYNKRTKMQEVVKNIPIADAIWLGKLLQPLSDDQIRDVFRAAGYNDKDVEDNATVVKHRIRDLNRLDPKRYDSNRLP
jgi:hypothetical protein